MAGDGRGRDGSAGASSAGASSAGDPERLLAELGAALGEEIVEVVPRWVVREVDRLVAAWEEAGGDVDRVALRAEARQAGQRAGADVAARLRGLLSADVDAQSSTPLEIVRGAVQHPTAVLRRAGVPAVVRDRFDEERFPDDLYGLTPASLGAVDPLLTEPAREWGAAKAMAHATRHRRG